MSDWIEIVTEPIAVERLLAAVASPEAGASSVFLGTVRNHNHGRAVQYLEYECYPAMACAEIARLVARARERWDILAIAVVHRTGRLEIGETAVAIAVASVHRQDGLEALRFVIDTLKATVPIWKKEYWADGSLWLENCCG
jgi:molybdopterin synthase catalytic subunit